MFHDDGKTTLAVQSRVQGRGSQSGEQHRSCGVGGYLQARDQGVQTTGELRTTAPPRVESAGAASARRGGTLSFDDLRGSRRQLDRPEFIVGSVEDVAPHPGVGSFDVASGALDLGAIEGCDVVVRRCCDGDLRREISQVEVAFSQGMGGDDVPDVHDRCGHDVVEAVAFEEPAPAVLAEVGEWFAADQVQRGDQVGHALGAATLAAGAEPAEEVEIGEDAVQGVGRGNAVLMGLLSPR